MIFLSESTTAAALSEDTTSIVDTIVSVFSLLLENTILGVPLLVWFIIPVIFGFIFDLVKERKKKE